MLEPVNSGKRYVILEPTSMENADVDVWVNGQKQIKSNLLDSKRQLFNYSCDTRFNGFIEVKIVVNKGLVSIGEKDAYGIYPVTYDYHPTGIRAEGLMRYRQNLRLKWIHNPSAEKTGDLNYMIHAGESFSYKHLIANTPEWFRVFFHNDEYRKKFLETGMLTEKMAEESVVIPESRYFVKDFESDIETRTNNLINDSGA